MFAAPHSDINPDKSGLLHLTGQPNSQKGREVKVKDGIISETKFLGTYPKLFLRPYKLEYLSLAILSSLVKCNTPAYWAYS
jgi:hypothetical protein